MIGNKPMSHKGWLYKPWHTVPWESFLPIPGVSFAVERAPLARSVPLHPLSYSSIGKEERFF